MYTIKKNNLTPVGYSSCMTPFSIIKHRIRITAI